MEKILAGNRWVSVSPAVIAGALVGGKANYITLGSFGGMSLSPPTVYISINKAHYTNAGIKENGYFSVNIPSRDLIGQTEYVGRVSGRDTDKSGVFTAFYGSVNKAPMIAECPVNMLCKLINTIDLPRNEVFVGEIVETYVAREAMVEDKPDMKKIDPLVLAGSGYWGLGDVVKKRA